MSVPPSEIKERLYSMMSASQKREYIDLKSVASINTINANKKYSLSLVEIVHLEGIENKNKKLPAAVLNLSNHVSTTHTSVRASLFTSVISQL